MILAELEAFFSRPVAPTRRIALGAARLPVDPAPGFGAILLAGVCARFRTRLDEEFHDEVDHLVHQLGAGSQVTQPRLRHRFQQDRVGLSRCTHRLVGRDESIEFRFQDDRGTPAQHVLAAVYALTALPEASRQRVAGLLTMAMATPADLETPEGVEHFVARLAGRAAPFARLVSGDPLVWALGILGLQRSELDPSGRTAVQRAYRAHLMGAHPDQGGRPDEAAERIAALGAARRILLGSISS